MSHFKPSTTGSGMLRKLATFSVRHKWLVVLTWLFLVVGATVAGQSYGGSFNNDLSVEDTDSQAAYDTLAGKFPEMSGDAMQVVIHDSEGVTGARVQRVVGDVLDRVADLPGVASVQSPYGAGSAPAEPHGRAQPRLADAPTQPRMVSEDRTTAVATVRFADRTADIDQDQVDQAQAAFADVEDLGVQVEFGGAALNTESGPSGSEVIGLAAAVLVLLLAFGSVFAMLVPLLTAVMALGLGMGIIHLLAEYVSIGTAGPVVAAMIGLGVGIDYALLVVTRHREGLATGHEATESIPIALSTAGRSVLVAGTTVIIAILSLYLIGIPFVSTLGLASAITVATTLLAAVTLLPALLAVFGHRLDRFRVRRFRLDHGGGHVSGWHRWTHHVQRRPWPYLVAAVAILATMAVPLLSLRLGTADDGSAPEDSTEREAFTLIERGFGAGWTGPLLVSAEYDGSRKDTLLEADRLAGRIEAVGGVEHVAPPAVNEAGDTAVLTVVPTTSPDEEETEDLVHRLRDEVLVDEPASAVHVGGATATSIDLADKLEERMVWFIAFVVGLSFLLLLVEFRSLFVPVKAALMNLLSVGAAYGAVVAVFQWGWLADVIGAEPGPIESFAPMMLFAVLFGLSMDYEVFLLSRVREEYLSTRRARSAVADGIAATARVITAAAAVMVVVFSSFLLNEERVVNLFGFGLAVAIAIDATIVRLVLVPAIMAVAGRAAWYLPRWLDRLLPQVELEPIPFDPFERELDEQDELEPVGAGPRHAATEGREASAPAADVALTSIARAPTSEAAPSADDSIDAALRVLRTAADERDDYRRLYEQALLELTNLQRGYDALVAALRTLREAGGSGVVPADPLAEGAGLRLDRGDTAAPVGRDTRRPVR